MSRPAIFITGAAAGIGRATALRFAAGGWFVGVYDVDTQGLDSLLREIPQGQAIAATLDVRDAHVFGAALAAFFDAAGGRLDLLFNNAGLLATGDFESIALARHQALVDVNLKGVINGCALALPFLQRTPQSAVINMCSASAVYGTPAFASYSATKFAVKGFTEALDIEWARHGIRVMDLLPLFVATPMLAQIGEAPASVERLGVRLSADDIAGAVWRAAHWRGRRRVHWYPGLQSRALAVLQKLAPAGLNRLVTRLAASY